MVLNLIIEDEGGDGRIELKRGNFLRAPSGKAKYLDGGDITETDEIGEIEAEVD